MYCKNCGNPLNEGTNFCQYCGTPNDIIQTQNNNYQNFNGMQPKKLNPLIIIIPIIIIIIIAVGIFIYFLSTNMDNIKSEIQGNPFNLQNDSAEYGKATTSDCGGFCSNYRDVVFDVNDLKIKAGNEKEITKNIQIIKAYRNIDNSTLDYKKIIIYGKNNNDYPVAINFNFNVYDNDNYRLDKAPSHLNVVNANSEFAIEVSTSVENTEFTKYNIDYTASNIQSYYKTLDIKKNDLVVTASELYGSKTVNFSYRNNMNQAISNIYVIIKFFKNNKLVFVYDGYIWEEIAPGESKSNYKFYPNVEFDKIDYDIAGAYYYDDKNW